MYRYIGFFLVLGINNEVASAAETTSSIAPAQDAFVSNFSGQGNSLGINLSPTKLIYGKFRHAYFKFDLSSIDTDRYNIDEMKMMLSFRKSMRQMSWYLRKANRPCVTRHEWTINNVTYNTRPNDIAGSPVVTRKVTSTGEENLSIDLSTIFQNALSNGRKVVSIHLTTTQVDDSTVSASELYSSRNTTYTGTLLKRHIG